MTHVQTEQKKLNPTGRTACGSGSKLITLLHNL